MLEEFEDFLMRGTLVELAVAFVRSAATRSCSRRSRERRV